MGITFLPDWFGSNSAPPPVCEYQTCPRSVTIRDTGEVKYYCDYRSGLVWLLNRATKPGEQVDLSWLAEQLATSADHVSRRLAKLVDLGEVKREHVTNFRLQQVEKYTLTDLGRQRLAEYEASNIDT